MPLHWRFHLMCTVKGKLEKRKVRKKKKYDINAVMGWVRGGESYCCHYGWGASMFCVRLVGLSVVAAQAGRNGLRHRGSD